jgi:hypothetical protein
MSLMKDDKGHWSSMRAVLIASFLVLIYQLYEFRAAYRLEIIKDQPDYNGLSLLFASLVTNFIFVVILKVIQKKFES